MRRVTLGDVASHAGVSKATVSMVLNDNPKVADLTRRRVQESIKSLGYIYDRAAASLRKPQSQAIGMIVTQLTNPYFAEFVEGIQTELDSQGMDILLGVSGEDLGRQARLLRSMTGRRVDGVVLIPAHGTTAETLERSATPLLMLARYVEGLEADYVGADNVAGARSATTHLLHEHGCVRPAFAGGFSDASARKERLLGFHQAAQEIGVSVHPQHLPTFAPDRAHAREAARSLFRPGANTPDAVLCFNDLVAFGVMDALTEVGLEIGRDVRVIGFDDVSAASVCRPSLSSVSVQAKAGGARAATMLLGRVNGLRTEPVSLVLETHLECRESCGCDVTLARAS